jgi:hypothetical protein
MNKDQLKKIMDLVLSREKKIFKAAQSDMKQLENKLDRWIQITDSNQDRIEVLERDRE